MSTEANVHTSADELGSLHEICVGRQAILNRDLDVFAYEMLFRGAPGDTEAVIFEDDSATSRVFLNTFIELGLERLCSGHFAFFNVTREFLLEQNHIPFAPVLVAFEILEGQKHDEALFNAVKAWSERGYTIVLDDFVWSDLAPGLLKYAHIVKLDVRALDREELRQHVEWLLPWSVRLVAEKVETQEEFEFCKALGFHYFQGYFYNKPDIVTKTTLPDNSLAVLRLLNALDDPDVSAREMEQVVRNDVALSYKLLRCVNSAFYGVKIQITSIKHAIVYLGIDAVRNWAHILLLAGLQDRPPVLSQEALIRARLCEQIAHLGGGVDPDSAFTTGLFSMLDAMLNMPLENALAELSLATEINSALLERDGALGQLLDNVIALERLDYEAIQNSPLPLSEWSSIWLEALEWTEQALAISKE